jgi:hypothetical protein
LPFLVRSVFWLILMGIRFVRNAPEQFAVATVVHHDLVFKAFGFHGRISGRGTEAGSVAQGEGLWKGVRAGSLTPRESGGQPAEDAEEAKGCYRQQAVTPKPTAEVLVAPRLVTARGRR